MAMPSESYSENQASSTNQYQTTAVLQFEDATGTTHGSNGTVESVELLRWRADILLDEMLLGGADVGTGHAGLGGMTANGVHSPLTKENHNATDLYVADTYPVRNSVRNGYSHDPQQPGYAGNLPPSPAPSPAISPAASQEQPAISPSKFSP